MAAMSKTADSSAGWLAVVRVYTGFFWLTHALFKWQDAEWTAPHGSMATIVQQMAQSTSGFYHNFLVGTVLPNAALFANLVRWGETLTAISLLLGLWTRLGGLGGVFLPLNYWLAKGAFAHLDGYGGLDAAALVLSFINVVLPTNRVFALDALLRSRRRAAK